MAEKEPFEPFTIEIQEIGKIAVRYTFMTEDELDFWWANRDTGYEMLNHGQDMLGKDF